MPGINAAACGDNYTAAATVQDTWNSRGGWFSVAGQSAYVELQYGKLGFGYWTSEQLLGAGAYAFVPANCVGVRFRNGTAGLIATVTAYIAQGDEPPLSIISAGSVALVSSNLNFQHNDLQVATEPTVDFEDSATLTWTVADDPGNTRVKVTPTVIGAPPTGAAGGVLSGSYPNPGMAAGAAATNLGSAGGDLTGTYPSPTIAANAVTTAKLAAAVTLDAIATAHATVAAIAMNGQKITGLANGSAATDAAAFGQLATAGPISSVFTRTGAVVAVAGDYTLTQIGKGTQHRLAVSGATDMGDLAAGSTGQLLASAGTGADPAWTSPTYPTASVTAGKILRSDGTNIVASTPTFPNAAGTAANVLRSDGTNFLSAALAAADLSNGTTGSGTVMLAASPTTTGTLTAAAVAASSSILSSSPTAGTGYATGAGGTVTQLTNKTTAVTLNTATGQIVMNAANLNANARATFVVNNSAMAATDGAVAWVVTNAGSSIYAVSVVATGNGFFDLSVLNVGGVSEAVTVTLGFAVVKSVTS